MDRWAAHQRPREKGMRNRCPPAEEYNAEVLTIQALPGFGHSC